MRLRYRGARTEEEAQMQGLKRVTPTMVLAIGICAATALAIVTATSFWLLAAGPVVLDGGA
jgi:hypothetical protein